LCRRASIPALESDLFRSSSDIHAFSCVHFIYSSVHCYDPIAADVDDAHLSSLEKVLGSELISRCQFQFSAHRHCRSCNDSVDMAVDQIDLIRLEQILDQEFLPEP